MITGVNEEDPQMLSEAVEILKSEADKGNAHAQSTLGYLHWIGCGVKLSDARAYVLHHFAAEGGNPQSKMALAYNHFRHQVVNVLVSHMQQI